MKTKGAAKYDALSEVNCPSYISQTFFSDAEKHKIESYAKIFSLFDSDNFKLVSVKKSISQNNPVIIGMKVPKSFYSATDIWTPSESTTGKYPGMLCA